MKNHTIVKQYLNYTLCVCVVGPLEVIKYILGHRIPGEAMTGGYGSKKLLSLKHRYILMIAAFDAHPN